MSGSEVGIPLVHRVLTDTFRPALYGGTPTHRAYRESYARALEAFAEVSARQPNRTDSQAWSDWWHEWSDARDALDAVRAAS